MAILRMAKHICQCRICGAWFACVDTSRDDCGKHGV